MTRDKIIHLDSLTNCLNDLLGNLGRAKIENANINNNGIAQTDGK
jgi:hypothetical protein